MVEGLHEHAVQAESHLEKLATGLAKSGADDQTVKAVSQMADVVRKIVVALGKGQENSADDEPPAPPAEDPQPRRQTMDSATNELHAEAQAKAAERQSQGGY